MVMTLDHCLPLTPKFLWCFFLGRGGVLKEGLFLFSAAIKVKKMGSAFTLVFSEPV